MVIYLGDGKHGIVLPTLVGFILPKRLKMMVGVASASGIIGST
jgi:hypothetical protein